MTEPILTPDEIRELFSYDPETGLLSWAKQGRGRVVGKPLTCRTVEGYVIVRVHGRAYMAHRLIWAHVHGVSPTLQIDHINQCKHDNRSSNLREVSDKQNHENISHNRNNTSGRRGVSWNTGSEKWQVHIRHHRKSINIGLFDNLEQAADARAAAERKYFSHRPLANA